MELDSALLSRLQFAFTVSFHIIFPSITIGLATLIAIWEGLWLKTRNPLYLQLAKFWIKPFAITFGMGVVSGIVLSYEFGTNFSRFSELTGAVLGPLMAYEVLTAGTSSATPPALNSATPRPDTDAAIQSSAAVAVVTVS